MNARRYGPQDTWPKHQKPFWKQALAAARKASWTLHYLGAPHCFGTVSCPSGQHSFRVDMTATHGESASLEAQKRIRTCQCVPADAKEKIRAATEKCARFVDEAERLIERACVSLDKIEAKHRAWEELERLELRVRTAEANLAEAEAISPELEEAWNSAFEADDAPSSGMISATLDDAVARVTDGESVANELKQSYAELARPRLQRARDCRDRISILRERLETFPEM